MEGEVDAAPLGQLCDARIKGNGGGAAWLMSEAHHSAEIPGREVGVVVRSRERPGTASLQLETPLVRVKDLAVRRDGRVVLEVPRLEVMRGEVLAIIGPNGAGKSTLLHTLALLLPPESGTIWFAGEAVGRGADLVRFRRRMAVVFQEPLLLDTSVKDNVASGLRLRGVPRGTAGERASRWMKRFGIAELAGRSARKLSGGEAQRVSLARAFALEPELLLLDEPFSALDAPTRTALLDDFEEVLKESGVTTLFVTHDRTEAMRLGTRVAVMMDGRVAQTGRPEEVFCFPVNEKVASFVGVENLVPGRVVEQRDGLAVVALDQTYLEAVGDVDVGRQVLACLRPEDLVLAPGGGEPQASSARNRLPGRVADLSFLGSQVRVSVDCGFPLVALITRRSAEDLGLRPGMPVTVSFKATAVHLIQR